MFRAIIIRSLLPGQITIVELAVALAVCNALVDAAPVYRPWLRNRRMNLITARLNTLTESYLGIHLWKKLEHSYYRCRRIKSSIRSTRLLRFFFCGNYEPLWEGIQCRNDHSNSLRRMFFPPMFYDTLPRSLHALSYSRPGLLTCEVKRLGMTGDITSLPSDPCNDGGHTRLRSGLYRRRNPESEVLWNRHDYIRRRQ
ncbi:hypothetical protein EDB19DRAFT_1210302 [Suillus lakei]|nr:hypothetical protein EDB19DRAFT_1210302 [Suillus lakei]